MLQKTEENRLNLVFKMSIADQLTLMEMIYVLLYI